jgi:hypothetical protein
MHRSGITVDDTLRADFAAAQKTPEVLFLKIKIANEVFKKTEEGKANNDLKADFAAIQAVLKPADPCFILTRAGVKADSGKWLTIFYVPESSIVKEKTMYASSISALKEGLGQQSFINDYHISTPAECSLAAYASWTKEHKAEDVLTIDEIIKREEVAAEGLAKGVVKTAAMADVNLAVDGKVNGSLQDFKDGKNDTVIMSLNAKFDGLQLDRAGNLTIEEIAKLMPAKDARYALHRFTHEHEGAQKSAYMFLYYCPDAAAPKCKMSYSTFKATAVKVVQVNGIEIGKQFECSEPAEIKGDAFLIELYPKITEKKVISKAKPKQAVKGKAGLIGGAKFSSAKPAGGSVSGAAKADS